MFRGRFEHAIDEKGRLAIPARFRLELGNHEEPTVIVTNFEKCLVAYPLEEWERLETKLAQLPQFDPKIIAFQRYFISGATECQLDKSGRILIPSTLRQYANLQKDCILLGNLNKFEIWSAETWHPEFNELSAKFHSITESMHAMGIGI